MLETNPHLTHHHAEEAIKLIFKGLIPVVLLISGLVLLILRLPGWSIIFGLPITIFGVIFLIYTYDEIVQKKINPFTEELANCSICGKLTPVFPGEDPDYIICHTCKDKGRRKK